MVGLWVALSAPPRNTGQQDTSTVRTAWLLTVFALLLLLTSMLALPAGPVRDTDPSTDPSSSVPRGPYSVPGGQAVPGYGTIGNVETIDTSTSK
ncbi:hypothetical protein [Pseudonocardia spinosispora]|uniref:hypothetical protein n=1 Tax=Pseudonocardia spinosispora TaxID=103441 RepID=UPI00049073C3|nr:hypothetical protein [Pseudonocardia spinosispora]